jgi:hypothetical protein
MESAAFVIGSVSLLAGFKGAIDGYVLLSDIHGAFDNSAFLQVKLKIEQHRLRLWGDFFGFTDDKECERLRKESPHAQGVVLYILMEIQSATTRIDMLVAKYGLQLADAKIESVTNPQKPLCFRSQLLDDLIQRQTEIKARLPRWRKGISWTLDNPKFEKLLDRLEYLNDSLERVVPRTDLGILALGLPSYLLPFQALGQLAATQRSSHEVLAACARAKEIKLINSLFDDVPVIDTKDCVIRKSENTGYINRVFGSYSSLDGKEHGIMIEWKDSSRNLTPKEQDIVLGRVKSLCRLFISPKPEEFRMLPCNGLAEDKGYAEKYPGHKRFGFVFRYPEPASDPPQSLCQLYDEMKDAPLGDRFRLAQALASGLLLLHSSNWLHKSLRSDGIMLFTTKQLPGGGKASLPSPFFCGFGYSRPDEKGQLSIERPAEGQVDHYRHPAWRNGYQRHCDIYSLGVILFEIGIWKPIHKICAATDDEESVKALLEHNATRRLRALMGDIYSTVVLRCLTGDLGPDTAGLEPEKAFWLKVVRELDECRA